MLVLISKVALFTVARVDLQSNCWAGELPENSNWRVAKNTWCFVLFFWEKKTPCKRNIVLKTDILDVFQSGTWCRRWMEAREDWLVVSPWICWRSVRRDQASVGRDRETKGKQKRESLQSVQAELRAEQQSLRKGMWVSKEGWIYHR